MKTAGKTKWTKGLLIGIMIFFVPFMNCKKEETKTAAQENKPALTGVVLFVIGDVQSGNRKLKAGDTISENESVQTGKKSACDLQIKELDAGVVMRMKSESVFQLKTMIVNGKPVPSAIVSLGSSMVNVSKKLKSDENFQVVTPTSIAGVRGTKFEVNVASDGSTSLTVSEGKVATRVRLEEAEELPVEIQEKSATITSVVKTLESQEQIIEAGHKTEVTKTQTNKILAETGLGDSIKQIQISSQEKLSEEEVSKAANTIDKVNTVSESAEKPAPKLAKESSSFKVEKIPVKDLQTQLKEYNELIAVEKQKLATTESTNIVVKERNEKSKEVLIKRIEEITGKSFETLILKSGKKVKGIIFLEGSQYYVITPDGQETYNEAEVEGMDL